MNITFIYEFLVSQVINFTLASFRIRGTHVRLLLSVHVKRVILQPQKWLDLVYDRRTREKKADKVAQQVDELWMRKKGASSWGFHFLMFKRCCRVICKRSVVIVHFVAHCLQKRR